MKKINTYIIERLTLSQKNNFSNINYDDVYDALYDYFSGDDFLLDPHGEKTGSGLECLEEIGNIGDILDFHNGWNEISNAIDLDVEKLQDFVSDNEEELYDKLIKNL